MTFSELGLRETVLQSVTELGFEAPTPIQQKAIPHLLQANSDFVGLAQTGTGKTAAFGLPLINNITSQKALPQALIICPTRELCLQITSDLQHYAKRDKHIQVVAVYGGADIRRQIKELKEATIIVATPGRLCDLIDRKAAKLNEVSYVVLDEADEMLNMGFKEDIDRILSGTPEDKNVWLFSATMPQEVARIAKNYMNNPLEVAIGHKNQTNENIEHIYYSVKEKDRYSALKRLIDMNPTIFGLVFCRTRIETQSVAEKLSKDGYSAEPLHGDLSQAQRDNVMKHFREHSIQLLVATDVAARGIDVDGISHVINYNLPDDIENYTHRSGRTARAGNKGQSLVLINTRESGKIRAIERQIRTTFAQGVIPSPEEICGVQLTSLIAKVKEVEVKEHDIEKFLPQIMEDFSELSKEEVIKKFISAEFNKYIEYYQRAGDLNAKSDRGSDRGDRNRSDRGSRYDRDENKTRFFVNLGKRDGLNPGGLLRVICDSTGLRSTNIGKIDVLPSFSFFEADNEHANDIIAKVNGSDYEGSTVSVEITKKDRKGGGGRDFKGGGYRGAGGGGRASRSGGSRDFKSSGSSFRDNKFGKKREDRAGGGFAKRPRKA